MRPGVRYVLAAMAVVVLAVGCSRSGEKEEEQTGESGVRVASFDFAESRLLAELYAQVLEAAGVPVKRLGPVGPREIVAPAMQQDLIDVVPEYLGTALQYAGGTEPDPDTASAFAQLNERLAPKGLVALTPSPAEDKNVVVVTVEAADAGGLVAISDLHPIEEGHRFGGPAECPDRPLCLQGLAQVYDLHFAEFVPQRSLAFTAEALRRGEIEAGMMFSTAAELEASDLVGLVDDLRLQPAENILPVVRSDAVERWGSALTGPLDAVSAALTTEDVRAMNVRVADGETEPDVARSWLVDHGLLDP